MAAQLPDHMERDMSDSRRVALITGAANGIGKAQALGFARRGYDLAIVDLQEAQLAAAADEVRALGAAVTTCVGDLTDLDFAKSCVEQAMSDLKRIDVLSNTAAWREIQPLTTTSIEAWEKTIRVMLTTPAFLCKWTAEHMIAAGQGGVMINISSVMAHRPNGTCPAYIAAKGGLDSLTYELAALYGHHDIRVVSIRPGAIKTKISGDYVSHKGENVSQEISRDILQRLPLGRLGEAEEVANAACWLASDEARYITGTTIDVDGGLMRPLTSRDFLQKQFPEQFS